MRKSSRNRKYGRLAGFSTGLAITIGIGMAPGTALAQAAEQPAEKEASPPSEEVESITVIGTRASLKSGIERKRNAGTVVDSIVAEDIAQFPDKNVGEALSRITGVQLSRDFGEGNQVSIRGVDPNLNRVEINGMSVLSANGGSARSNDFRELASELIKSVDVIKGSTADLTEGGIGGTVSISLRKPLELDAPLVSFTASAEQLSLDGGWDPRMNLTAATQLFDGRFGIMANFTYDHVLTRQDYLRNTEWVRLGDWDNAPDKTIESLTASYAAVTTEAACLTAFTVAADQNSCRQQWWDYSPRIPRYGIWLRDDKRTSGQLTLQYQISDGQMVWVEGTRAKREQFLNDHNYGTDFTGVNRVSNVATDVYDGLAPNSIVTVEDHHVTGWTVANTAPGRDAAFGTSARGFDLENTTDYLSAGYEYAGDLIQAKLGVSDVDSFRNDDTNSANFTARIPGFSVTLDDKGIPRFNFPTGLSMEDNAPYYTTQLQYRPSENELTERQASADFDFTPDLPFISSFEAGVQKRETVSELFNGGGYHDYANNVDIQNLNINLTGNLNVNPTAPNTTTPGTTFNLYNVTYGWNPATFNDALNRSTRSPGTFYDGYDVSGGNIPTDWRVPVFDLLAPMYNTEHFTHDELRHVTVNGQVYDRLPAHELTEDIFAEYFKINFDTELGGVRFRGNVGVREIKTGTTAAGAIIRNERRVGATPGTFTDVNTGTVHSSFERNYSDTLPSANLQIEIKENFSIRMGYAELMARPAIADLAPTGTCTIDVRPGFSTDADADDCNIGNPGLKPYRAKSYDLEFAFYPTDEIETRIGVFYKDINTYILGRVTFANVNLFGDGVLYDVTTPINGQGAKTKGIESSIQAPFTFLPGWLSGFGGLANYTWTDAEDVNLYSQLDGSPLPFVGLSENSYNVVLYYDKGSINARVAWNWRDDWLASAADRSGNPVFRGDEGYLDARLQWRIKGDDELSVFIEGKNLTDQASLVYAGEKTRLSEIGWPGRRYYIGIAWKPIS